MSSFDGKLADSCVHGSDSSLKLETHVSMVQIHLLTMSIRVSMVQMNLPTTADLVSMVQIHLHTNPNLVSMVQIHLSKRLTKVSMVQIHLPQGQIHACIGGTFGPSQPQSLPERAERLEGTAHDDSYVALRLRRSHFSRGATAVLRVLVRRYPHQNLFPRCGGVQLRDLAVRQERQRVLHRHPD